MEDNEISRYFGNNDDDDDDDEIEVIERQRDEINNLMENCEHNKEIDQNNNANDNENEGEIIINEDYEIGAEFVSTNIEEDEEEGQQPKLSQWEEDKVENDNISVTVAKARRRLWKKAKEEVLRIKKNVFDLKQLYQDQNRDDFYYLYRYMFGSSSLLAETLIRNLNGISEYDYLKFMITFLMSCKNQMSVPMMHFCQMINSDDLMDTDSYNLLWARLGTMGGSMRQQPFWMTMEETVNTTFKALFLGDDKDSRDTYLIGLDDDKLHFNYSNKSSMQGLKGTYHACDHRKGFTLHTAALSASCVPICVMFQRELESVQATYVRILKSLFGRERGEAAPDLRGVTLASDRGYWKPNLLFEHVLENGGNVEGTVQRVSFFVFFLYFFCCCKYLYSPISKVRLVPIDVWQSA